MFSELLKRRDAVIARNHVLESVPGSGYHDDDRFNGVLCSPQRKGLPRISLHVVPFYDRRDVHFVGKDAVEVLSGLQDWVKDHKPNTPEDLQSLAEKGSWVKLLVEVPKLKLAQVDGIDVLSLELGTWNDFKDGLYEMGFGFTGQQVDVTKQS